MINNFSRRHLMKHNSLTTIICFQILTHRLTEGPVGPGGAFGPGGPGKPGGPYKTIQQSDH